MPVSELLEFLIPDQRKDVRAIGLKSILDLTSNPDTVTEILACKDIIEAIQQNSYDDDPLIAKRALLTLVNLSADDVGTIKIFEFCNEIRKDLHFAVDRIIDENSAVAGEWCMLLNNLTRVAMLCVQIIDTLEKSSEPLMMHLFNAFADPKHNKAGATLGYLGSVFCNLTQTRRGREIICDKNYHFLKMLLPFTSYHPSPTRRKGVFGVIKNISFDTVHHDFLLSEDDDVLSRILYPLCGPEEYSDEENDAFPIQLQFLGESKAREDDADLRKTIFETLLQLCAIRSSREHLRAKGVYAILREYHKWEARVGADSCCLIACENVVDILIKNEQEIGVNDYKGIEVPADVAATFIRDDKA